jgi:hypothetical protein
VVDGSGGRHARESGHPVHIGVVPGRLTNRVPCLLDSGSRSLCSLDR